ncbi:hypothetical protein J5N97_006979 [Dioscorea zingiberensis]|uniref:Uncharacterized protein n=1 Tax=Dioscorea zingiberensis TaxID=325984 RepID=A0A9D5HU16_9LILI|nr:hypothetical protein J5N97_006979 [Dioscorea zingiberensis]
MDVDEGSGSSDSPVHEVEKDDAPAGSKRKHGHNPSPIVTKKKSVERALAVLDRLVELSDRRSRIVEQIKDEDDRFSYDICMEKLSSLPDVSDEEICVGAEALKSYENRIFFMKMRPSVIEFWLGVRVKEFRRQGSRVV